MYKQLQHKVADHKKSEIIVTRSSKELSFLVEQLTKSNKKHQLSLAEAKAALGKAAGGSEEKVLADAAKQRQEILYLVKLLSERKPDGQDFDAKKLAEIDKLKADLKKSETNRQQVVMQMAVMKETARLLHAKEAKGIQEKTTYDQIDQDFDAYH